MGNSLFSLTSHFEGMSNPPIPPFSKGGLKGGLPPFSKGGLKSGLFPFNKGGLKNGLFHFRKGGIQGGFIRRLKPAATILSGLADFNPESSSGRLACGPSAPETLNRYKRRRLRRNVIEEKK